MDIEELKRRLREGSDEEILVHAAPQAADALESLQRENADLRQRCDHIMTEHGKRVDEVARLKVELEEARRDAENWRTLKTLKGRVQWYWDQPATGMRLGGEVWSDDFGGLDAAMEAARQQTS